MAKKSRPTSCYKCFFSLGELLYVGMSVNARRRIQRHIRSNNWGSRIARTEIQWFGSKRKARAAETRAIALENPTYNIALAGPDRRYIYDELGI